MQVTTVLSLWAEAADVIYYQKALGGRERIEGEAEALSDTVDERKCERHNELKCFSSKKPKKKQ